MFLRTSNFDLFTLNRNQNKTFFISYTVKELGQVFYILRNFTFSLFKLLHHFQSISNFSSLAIQEPSWLTIFSLGYFSFFNQQPNISRASFNPVSSTSDLDRISPYTSDTISCRQVMRIKKNINKGIIVWSNSKFSKLKSHELCSRQ